MLFYFILLVPLIHNFLKLRNKIRIVFYFITTYSTNKTNKYFILCHFISFHRCNLQSYPISSTINKTIFFFKKSKDKFANKAKKEMRGHFVG